MNNGQPFAPLTFVWLACLFVGNSSLFLVFLAGGEGLAAAASMAGAAATGMGLTRLLSPPARPAPPPYRVGFGDGPR